MISFSPPDISQKEIDLVAETLRSGWITTGPVTDDFEKKIADYCNTARTLAVSSATAGMELVLRLLDVGPGDEVITTPYTYSASAAVIDHVGATIVFLDTAPDQFQMDYTQLASKVTKDTKVIMPVDLGGVPCDYDALFAALESVKHLYEPSNAIQAKFDRPVILVDAAHSFGATYKGIRTGTMADFSVFSFHAVKNLTTGEGGAITWRSGIEDDDDIYRWLRVNSLHGQNKDALSKSLAGSWEYDILSLGYKCNMTDIVAAIGIAQLERYDTLLARRLAIYDAYAGLMDRLGCSYLKHRDDVAHGNGHLFLVRLPGFNERKRNQFIDRMADLGVSCNVHYKPLPMFTAYKLMGFSIDDYPHAYKQYENVVSLPIYTLLSDQDVAAVMSAFERAYAELAMIN